MKRMGMLFLVCMLFAVTAFAVKVGSVAPDFTGTDSNGKTHKISDLKGKFVVLEWHNNGCPFTIKHYVSHNMQNMQKHWTNMGVEWFTILSSAPGQQGYVTAAEENAYMKKMGATPTAAILDPKGTVGHLYSAKTTPQMIVIDPQGKVIYDGAIDDHATTEASDIPGAKNYVNEALHAAMGGEPVPTASTRPYGCSVKYAE